ncbi:SAM-dependent methyltransferase [Thermovibrio guaymasensis]|uniref:SAM-dependent methyltransferase n=1 Tax=Thermovibrio guaymasensis TaxID=240167 RepID=UPI000EAF5871|nr:cyclopropane-fatty-acyl-phospholipid synthase family protein [Thermovibrio guaymasensis]
MELEKCNLKEVEELNEELVKELLNGAPGESEASVILWNGKRVWGKGDKLKIKIKTPWSLKEAFRENSDLSLAESYIYGLIDIEGDIFLLFPIVDWIIDRVSSLKERLRLWRLIRKLPGEAKVKRCWAEVDGELHSIERDKKAIQYHYDVSNGFYKLFLDKNMVYSCAYFRSYGDSLDNAQENKIDYICRKLMLKEGEKLLDIGCGWGALIVHAAKKYRVNAVEITLSENQYNYVRERIRKEGVVDRCKVLPTDYKEVDEWNSYDKIVSVGMFEHVGLKIAGLYFEQAFKLLKERGIFLNHAISCNYYEYGPPLPDS